MDLQEIQLFVSLDLLLKLSENLREYIGKMPSDQIKTILSEVRSHYLINLYLTTRKFVTKRLKDEDCSIKKQQQHYQNESSVEEHLENRNRKTYTTGSNTV